jgi:hypothetical protein
MSIFADNMEKRTKKKKLDRKRFSVNWGRMSS